MRRRYGAVVMPSEVADGQAAGAEAGPVTTYRLSDEELERYRREGKRGMPRPGKIDQAKLYAEFAAGRGEDQAGRKRLAIAYGVDVGSICYHHVRWAQAGRPGAQPAMAESEQIPVEGDQAETKYPWELEPEPIAAQEAAPTMQEQTAAPIVYRVANLCATCIKADVCRHSLPPKVGLHSNNVCILYGIVECSAYVEERAG